MVSRPAKEPEGTTAGRARAGAPSAYRALLERLSDLVPGRLRLAFRYWHRARQILRTEGPGILARKVQRRLGRTAFAYAKRPPVLLDLQEPFAALVFPADPAPAVSIVIPVFNNFRFTHHCLAALHRHAAAASFEVIVVDDCSTDGTTERLAAYENVRLLANEENLGFVRSCNRGARAARGDLLVFLNNDTQVQPGWLDALVETFQLRPDAGLVGSRLVYPDGLQQEAGGIVWADGSASLYGHLDDPGKPEYSYLRAVDYCSGASLAIRRSLFASLGGFDELYAPAYYEDTDLAFRVRQRGLQVYYQPLSTVVHYEGMTAGTELVRSAGVKRYQAINREKFFARWRDALRSHRPAGEQPQLEKDRGIRRRALVVDCYMLMPDRDSGSLRMINLLAVLQDLGFQVTFAAMGLEAPEPYVSDLQRRGVECLYRPYVGSVEDHLRHHGHRYDLVVLSRADTAAELMSAALRRCPRARVVFDTVDLHFQRVLRQAEVHEDRSIVRLGEARRRQELELIAMAHTTLVVSEAEKILLAEAAPDADVRVVSNIHQVFGSARPFAERADILFIGGFGHPPNTDAVRYFCKEIFPRVRAALPDVCVLVVGSDPPPDVRALESSHVRILGYVPDVEPFFARCRLSIAPLRFGAGVKGKVNQSLAYGLPVVATSVAVEGMFLVDGESALIADDPLGFADAMVRLYSDEGLWNRLSAGGLAAMEEHFSFAAARQALQHLVG